MLPTATLRAAYGRRMEMIADCGALASLDIVELNPALDVRNKTALLAVDLVESLFGKSTLMRVPQ